MLGVRAVIAESYERIHRSNLVGMGVLPLQFLPGDSAASLGLTGAEVFDVQGIAEAMTTSFASGREIVVHARRADGSERSFKATIRIDTPQEILYYQQRRAFCNTCCGNCWGNGSLPDKGASTGWHSRSLVAFCRTATSRRLKALKAIIFFQRPSSVWCEVDRPPGVLPRLARSTQK